MNFIHSGGFRLQECGYSCGFLWIPVPFLWIPQYFTLPHVSYRTPPDYPESRWVTNRHMDRPPDSAGLHRSDS